MKKLKKAEIREIREELQLLHEHVRTATDKADREMLVAVNPASLYDC